jgi:hypothetical protein
MTAAFLMGAEAYDIANLSSLFERRDMQGRDES